MAKTKPQTDAEIDAAMMANPIEWPRWPYLPIKRRGARPPECGLLYATKTPWAVVYLANLYRMPPTLEEFLATKKYEYISVTALQADGWVVD